VAEREWHEAEAAAAEAGAAAAAAEEAARSLGQRVTEAGDELDRVRAAISDVTGELERLRAAEVQAQESVDDVKKAYDAAEATSLATRQRAGMANSALEQAAGRRGLKP
jgi:chromosome segregation ATPase